MSHYYDRNENGQFVKGMKNPYKLKENNHVCELCGKEFRRGGRRGKVARFCSFKCKYIGTTTGAGFVDVLGYFWIRKPGHPRVAKNNYIKEHIFIAEQVFGKPLPQKAVVHHVNKKRSDNRHSNLVICEDASYHQLLHIRTRAYEDAGNANFKHCGYCKKHDSPSKLKSNPSSPNRFFHVECDREYKRKQWENTKKTARNSPAAQIL